MKPLHILSTSFLIPNHPAWKPLGSNLGGVLFGNYGEYVYPLSSLGVEDDVCVIFTINDIIDQCLENNYQQNPLLTSFILALEGRLEKSSSSLIVAVAYYESANPIGVSKRANAYFKLHNWLIEKFEALSSKHSNFYFLDLNRLFYEDGFKLNFDTRNWYFAHCRYSSAGLSKISNAVKEILYRVKKPASKVIVLDCDNTLWGGVIGEDGLHGIVLGGDGLGNAFVDFQKQIQIIIEQGTLAVIASKNNEDDVWEVFDKHESMELTRNNIVAWKINWTNKSQGIKEMALELDLGLESFVFWDDNPMERDQVRAELPEVVVIEVPKNVLLWPEYIKTLPYFQKFSITKEDGKKTEQYANRAKFIRDLSQNDNQLNYLKSINLKPRTIPVSDANVSRASQLCLKTNQFNLRTIRHDEQAILNLSKENQAVLFLTALTDIYGDHGIVGMVCGRKINKKTVFIDTFLMSCRVLGRHLESWMLYQLVNESKKIEAKYVVAEFIKTNKNTVASSFLIDHGFKPIFNIDDEFLLDNFVEMSKGGEIFVLNIESFNTENIKAYE